MVIANDVSAAVGNTPLIKLRRASEETGCTILGKAEFMNPGQSVKDRAALFIIRDALERGTLKPGGTIVEAENVAGVELGDLLNINVYGTNAPVTYYDAKGGVYASNSAPVSAGTLTITMECNLTYELK